MADLIRPEARAAIWRWREVLAGLAMAGVGAWFTAGFGLLVWLGGAVIALAAVLIITGLQRARFRGAANGPGIVTIDEGQLAYFGPLAGGVLSIRDMAQVTLDPTGHPLHWQLTDRGGATLTIPATAGGADLLFDVFATLPGFDTPRMLAVYGNPPKTVVTIWRRSATDH